MQLSLFAILAAGAASAERLPIQADVDICARRAAELGDTSLAGGVRLQILTRADGQVYAAYIYSSKGAHDKVFDFCLASNALLWQYQPVGLDTTAAFPITVVPGSSQAVGGSGHSAQIPPEVFLPSEHPTIEPSDLDVPRAQASLNVLETASSAERGQAFLAVHEYPEAIAELRGAVEKDPNDRIALRGLAQALAESAGDLAEARAVAMKLISVAPDSVVGHEALLRVCAAAKDDPCVFQAWTNARKMGDVAPRSRILQDDLQPLAEKSATRLRSRAQERKSQAAAEVSDARPPPEEDVCINVTPVDKQALCEVKRCLDAGSALYAQEISTGGAIFEVGDWRFKNAGTDRLLVTRPISSKAKEGAPAEHRDAIFLVKLGARFSIQPSTSVAMAIVQKHNACAPAPSPATVPPAAPVVAPPGGTPPAAVPPATPAIAAPPPATPAATPAPK